MSALSIQTGRARAQQREPWAVTRVKETYSERFDTVSLQVPGPRMKVQVLEADFC